MGDQGYGADQGVRVDGRTGLAADREIRLLIVKKTLNLGFQNATYI